MDQISFSSVSDSGGGGGGGHSRSSTDAHSTHMDGGAESTPQPSTSSCAIFNGVNDAAAVVEQNAQEAIEWLSMWNYEQRIAFFRSVFQTLDNEPLIRALSTQLEGRLRRILSFEEPFSILPKHLSLHILSFLDPCSLCSCMRVCRRWNGLVSDPLIWRALCNGRNCYRMCSPEMESDHLRSNVSTNGTVMWKRAFSERYRLWRNWHAGRCVIRTFTGHEQGVSCVQFDARRIVSGSSDSTIRIWDLKTNCGGVGQMTLTGHSQTVRCLHLDNSRLASGSNDHSIKIWDLAINVAWSHVACRRTLLGHTNIVRCLEMSDDKLFSGSYDRMLKLWSIETGQCITTLQGNEAEVLCLQYDATEHRVLFGTADSAIRMWDVREPHTPNCTMTIHNAHDEAVTCVRFDREKIASGSVDRTIKMWELRSGKCLQTIDWRASEGHTAVVRCLQMDGWRMVSSADDKTIKVWKLSNGERLCTLKGHADGVTCVQFNDYRIVSGSYDRTVKLWDFSIC